MMNEHHIEEFRQKYKGLPAAVLGGGPSLPSDLKRLPDDCILIAVNDHALHFCQPDYLVFMDIPNREEFPGLFNAIENFKGILVSQTPLSNIKIKGEVPYWDGGFTSTFAVWFAEFLGCDPILLCGMDCYQGEEKYCHPRPDFYHLAMDAPLEDHLNAWRPALTNLGHPERVKAVSGPLVEVFGVYKNML